MYSSAKSGFSQRPAYNANVVDDILAKYCNLDSMKHDTAKGIDVTRRKEAILNSLNTTRQHIFGELEMGLIED